MFEEAVIEGLIIAFSYWWVYVPPILAAVFLFLWKEYIQARALAGWKWTMMELKIPTIVERSPKITEQIFAALHAIYDPPTKCRPGKAKDWFKDNWIKGKLQPWFSFEAVSTNGHIYFYIKCLDTHKTLVQSQLYAQYPDIEITDVPGGNDYVTKISTKFSPQEYEMFGTEIILDKDPVYPVQTYIHFEEPTAAEAEFRRIDPLASLVEVLAHTEPGEHIWLQYIARPTGDDWTKKAKDIIDEMLGRKKPPATGGILGKLADALYEGIRSIVYGAFTGIFTGGETPKEEKKEEKEVDFSKLTPGKQEVIKRIELNITKLAYDAVIRYVYVAEKDKFREYRTTGVMGAFKQFAAQDLNSFKQNKEAATRAKGRHAEQKTLEKKQKMYDKYRTRALPDKFTALNVETLATLYHIPEMTIKMPTLGRIEAKKGSPPVSLPTGEGIVLRNGVSAENHFSETATYDSATSEPPKNLPTG